MTTQVLVVGAGPVGLAMAAELVRYGVPVRVVDKAARRTDKSKALVLWSRTLELIDRMGCGALFVAAGNRCGAVNVFADGRRIAHVEFETAATPHPYALMIPQSETERLLEEQLNRLGVEVERTVELTRFATRAGGVTALLRHPDGREEALDADWLIGCDGAHSTVRHGLGMAFAGSTLLSDWVLADVHLEGVPMPPDELGVYWHSDGVLALFPILPGRYRVVADIKEASPARRADPTLGEVQALLDRRGPGGIRASDPFWLSSFRINERKVMDYRAGRVFLAGDAAHVHSPAGGQGMNTGIQDACNLAWKLALVCRGTCALEPLLGSYSVERSEVGRQVLAATGRLTALAVMHNPAFQAVRNHVASLMFGLAPVRRAMADKLTELSVGYPESPLTRRGPHRHGPMPGERAPVSDSGRPVGSGPMPRFALFAAADKAGAALITRYGDLLEPETRPPFIEDGIWLVRPDGYVAMTAGHGRWDEVDSYLNDIAGAAGHQH